MVYNYDFEIAGLFFLAIISVYYYLHYRNLNIFNKCFKKILLYVFLMNVLDIFTGVCITHHEQVPEIVNALFSMAMFDVIAILAYYYGVYAKTLINNDGKIAKTKVNLYLLIAFLVLEVLNLKWGFFFSFDETGYVHGPLYLCQSIFDMYFLVYVVGLLIVYHKKMDKLQIMSNAVFVVLIMLGTFVQVVFMPSTLLGGFGASLCTLVSFLSLETPEYMRQIGDLNDYNCDLEREVEEKTEKALALHDKMILGIADLVGSRDNSTGGHINRTSRVVSILADEMRKDTDFCLKLNPRFFDCLIKAAPMHDLGKIAVEDAILKKPGKYTDDEYLKMKKHAINGQDIIQRVLVGGDDVYFEKIAENVAHYHHEKYDGSGYPEGLKGEEIPLEARIMALADVYDALVSKRCYKEKVSFEKAFEIIETEMGGYFDPALNKYFVNSRKKLEDYYRSIDA